MHATTQQTEMARTLINAHKETGPYSTFYQRVLLTAKQHRIMTEGWAEGTLPWGNRMETDKGLLDWRLFPGPLGYFLEYKGYKKDAPVTVTKTHPVRKKKSKATPPGLPVSVQVERMPSPAEVALVEKQKRAVEQEQAKAKTIVTGEMWQVYRGKKWVKLDHPVKLKAYAISGDHYARVLDEWKKLKVTNIESSIVEEPAVQQAA